MVAEKILAIDPERLGRSLLCQKCEEWGYEVLEADSGKVGLRLEPRLYIPEGGTSLEEMEHALIVLAMRQADGNQT